MGLKFSRINNKIDFVHLMKQANSVMFSDSPVPKQRLVSISYNINDNDNYVEDFKI